MIRAFVALPLPEDIRDRLEVVQEMLPLSGRVPSDNFHVTLAFLDSQPVEVLEAVHDGLAALTAPPLSLAIDGLNTFGGDRTRLVHASVVPDPALSHLQAKVARIAVEAGIPLAHRRFVPHVTLSRDRPRGHDLARLEHALLELGGFRAGPFDIEEMILYRATLGRGPAIYDPLARYPLTG